MKKPLQRGAKLLLKAGDYLLTAGGTQLRVTHKSCRRLQRQGAPVLARQQFVKARIADHHIISGLERHTTKVLGSGVVGTDQCQTRLAARRRLHIQRRARQRCTAASH